MILTFKPKFIEPIKAGTKIHTIREDKTGRWKTGMKIQFWNGNPRNVKAKPHQFQSGICTDVKYIILDFVNNDILTTGNKLNDTVFINDSKSLNEFAVNDGFENWEELKNWFINQYNDYYFTGILIYFKVHANR